MVAIACGDSHGLALKNDGRMVAWGVWASNAAMLSTVWPWPIDVRAIGAGYAHSMAVLRNGTAVGWGNNQFGQASIPNGLSAVQAVDGGTYHSLALSAPSIAFDDQQLLTASTPKNFVIRNTGDLPLTITGLRPTGPHASDFVVDSGGAVSAGIPAGGEAVFSVRFHPVHHGARQTMLQVVSEESTLEIFLSGDAFGPELAVFPGSGNAVGEELSNSSATHRFAGTNVGQASTAQVFTVKNLGNIDLTGLALSVSGDAGDFSLGALGASSLAPDATTTFTVTFSPVTTGTRNAVLTLASNAFDENSFRIQLTGEGEMLPVIALEQDGGNPLESRAVVSWGTDGFATPVTEPEGLSGIQAISAAAGQVLALRGDGTVTAWGVTPNSGFTAVPAGLSDIVAIAAGRDHSVALSANGLVFAWGLFNTYGQSTVPSGLTGVKAIAAGERHTLALKADGTVIGWGSDINGQRTVPTGLAGVRAITAGGFHNLALKTDGTVAAWGKNDSGQTNVPLGLTGVQSVAAGSNHSVALKADGTVVAWGYNFYGQRTIPAGLTGVQAIAAGGESSIALKQDGSLVIWGRNDLGEITVPDGLTGFEALSAGGHHIVALVGARLAFGNQSPVGPGQVRTLTIRNTGAATLDISSIGVAGGQAQEFIVNTLGMLTQVPPGGATSFNAAFTPNGRGYRRTTLTVLHNDTNTGPVQIYLTGTGIEPDLAVYTGSTIAAGDERTDQSSPFHFADTNVGRNSAAQTFTLRNRGNTPLTILGLTLTGDVGDFRLEPMVESTVAPNAALTFSVIFSPLVNSTRSAVVHLTSDDPDENPFRINLLGNGVQVPEISIEQPAGVALPPRRVVAWGNNNSGQTNLPSGLSGVKAIAAGGSQSLVLKQDGTLATWGSHTYGHAAIAPSLVGIRAIVADSSFSAALLEDGTAALWGFSSPTPPGVLGDVQDLTSGSNHTVVLKSDGTVVAWGNNSYGETTIPAGLTGVRDISAGESHSAALKHDGTVVAWGDNSSGQSTVPAGLDSVQAMAAGAYHTVSLKTDGTLVAWGSNAYGQRTVPGGLAAVQAIAARGSYTLALKRDSTVAAWGRNDSGQTAVPAGLSGVQAIAAGWQHALALVIADVTFGDQNLMTGSPVKTFIVRNAGNAPLTLGSASLAGGDINDFTVNPVEMRNTLALAGDSTAFTVRFTPRAAGLRQTTLRVPSNDPNERVFEIRLSGAGTGQLLTTIQNWRQFYFKTSANDGNASDSEDPDSDSIPNLLEFAFGTDPLQLNSGPAGLEYTGTFAGDGTIIGIGQPIIMVEAGPGGQVYRALFVRRKEFGVAGLTYTPEFSSDLSTWQIEAAPPSVLADDGIHQIVGVSYPTTMEGHAPLYFRLRVGIAP